MIEADRKRDRAAVKLRGLYVIQEGHVRLVVGSHGDMYCILSSENH